MDNIFHGLLFGKVTRYRKRNQWILQEYAEHIKVLYLYQIVPLPNIQIKRMYVVKIAAKIIRY